jgi:hypothetical protein
MGTDAWVPGTRCFSRAGVEVPPPPAEQSSAAISCAAPIIFLNAVAPHDLLFFAPFADLLLRFALFCAD